MTRRPYIPAPRRAALAAAAALMVAGACGGGGSGSSASGDSASSGQFGSEEFGLSLEELANRIEQTESLIGECMAAAGFTYTPVDFASIKDAMDSSGTAPGLSDEEYVAQFGFGITTQLDNPMVVFGAGPENNAVRDALPAADQTAYQRTLLGEALDWNHVRALEDEDFSQTQGCTRSAAEQAYDTEALAGSYRNPADKFIEQDPRMIAAFTAWSECMSAEGYEFGTPDELEASLRERLNALAAGQDPRTLTGPALDSLTELQGEERAAAGLAESCFDDHVADVEEQVEAEVYGAPVT